MRAGHAYVSVPTERVPEGELYCAGTDVGMLLPARAAARAALSRSAPDIGDAGRPDLCWFKYRKVGGCGVRGAGCGVIAQARYECQTDGVRPRLRNRTFRRLGGRLARLSASFVVLARGGTIDSGTIDSGTTAAYCVPSVVLTQRTALPGFANVMISAAQTDVAALVQLPEDGKRKFSSAVDGLMVTAQNGEVLMRLRTQQ
eukprot:2248933-Rhodomonas_salina.1